MALGTFAFTTAVFTASVTRSREAELRPPAGGRPLTRSDVGSVPERRPSEAFHCGKSGDSRLTERNRDH
jgi:hypothetical protein